LGFECGVDLFVGVADYGGTPSADVVYVGISVYVDHSTSLHAVEDDGRAAD